MSRNKLTKGFFGQMKDRIRTKYYERSMFNRQNYLQNWENIKWKVRFSKLAFIVAFSYGVEYLVSPIREDIAKNKEEAVESLYAISEKEAKPSKEGVVKLLEPFRKFFDIETVHSQDNRVKLMRELSRRFSAETDVSVDFYFISHKKKDFYDEFDEEETLRQKIE